MRDDEKKLPNPVTKRSTDQAWHGAVVRYADALRAKGEPWPKFMYEARTVANEVPRLVSLFRRERLGELPKVHRQCSISEPETVEDNHLTCVLGVKCRECPALRALASADMGDDERDRAKAWTCVTHILLEAGGDVAREGYIVTTDDRMFWSTVYASLAADNEDAAGGER